MNADTKFFLKALWDKSIGPVLEGTKWVLAFLWGPLIVFWPMGAYKAMDPDGGLKYFLTVLLFFAGGGLSVMVSIGIYQLSSGLRSWWVEFMISVRREAETKRQNAEMEEERVEREALREQRSAERALEAQVSQQQRMADIVQAETPRNPFSLSEEARQAAQSLGPQTITQGQAENMLTGQTRRTATRVGPAKKSFGLPKKLAPKNKNLIEPTGRNRLGNIE